jgi:hypothetical protein
VGIDQGWKGRMKKPRQGESKEGSGITALFFSPTKKYLKVTHMTILIYPLWNLALLFY